MIRGPQESQGWSANSGLGLLACLWGANRSQRDPVFRPRRPPELSECGGEGKLPGGGGVGVRSERAGRLGGVQALSDDKEGRKPWKERRLWKEESEGILKLPLERIPGKYYARRGWVSPV